MSLIENKYSLFISVYVRFKLSMLGEPYLLKTLKVLQLYKNLTLSIKLQTIIGQIYQKSLF